MSERRKLSIPEKVGVGAALLVGWLAISGYKQSREDSTVAKVFNTVHASALNTFNEISADPGRCTVDSENSTIHAPNGESLYIDADTQSKAVVLRPINPDTSSIRLIVGPDGAQDDGYIRVEGDEFHTSNPNTNGIEDTVPVAEALLKDFQNNC